jgi:peptide/nickel transport system substrate-binding protein
MTDASPLSWAFDPNIKPYPYDPALARSILAADGWRPGPDGILEKGGKPFAADVTTVIGNPSRLEAEQMMQAQLKQVGIELSLRNYPANVLFSAGPTGVLTAGKFDIALYGWTETPDPDDTDTLSPQSIPPNGVNYSRYADPDIAAWQDRGKSLYVRAARIPYYWKIQQRIHDEVPFHTINWQAHVNAVNTDLQNYRPAPAIADFWNAYEWKI